jgi:hypothetical protein
MIEELARRGVPEPTKEYKFHPTRRWKLDWAWPSIFLGVEIHGGVYAGGRHTNGQGFTNDREKMNEAALCGFLVIEITTQQLKELHRAADWIEAAYKRLSGLSMLEHFEPAAVEEQAGVDVVAPAAPRPADDPKLLKVVDPLAHGGCAIDASDLDELAQREHHDI